MALHLDSVSRCSHWNGSFNFLPTVLPFGSTASTSHFPHVPGKMISPANYLCLGYVALVAVKIFITILRFLFFFFSLAILTDSTVNRRVTVSRTRTGQWRRRLLQTADWRVGIKCQMQNTDFQITHRVITIIETNRKQGYSAQTEWKSAR